MGGIRIGSLFGFTIAIHPSWFIVLVVFSVSLANGFFPSTYAGWSPATYWVVGLLASLLLFGSVLVHELAHSFVARSQGIPVRDITLFLLGGVASIEKEASTPRREAALAGVGPLTSFAIGLVCSLAARVLPLPETVEALLVYLAIANVILAVFNLVPGFPLDGGRVLRALLWARSGDFERATRTAARIGQGLGWVFIAGGVLVAFGASVFSGLWLGFVGWVLVQASQASLTQIALQRGLAGVTVAQLMSPPVAWVSPYITLSAAAERYFLEHRARCLPVEPEVDGQAFDGIVCLSDLQRTPRSEWDVDRVRDVMTAADAVVTVTPSTPAADALRLMAEHNVNQVAVVEDGRLVGFVDRGSVLRYLEFADLARRER